MEKPRGEGGMINGGFFVLAAGARAASRRRHVWEQQPLNTLAARAN
jgi:hypothetical protein